MPITRRAAAASIERSTPEDEGVRPSESVAGRSRVAARIVTKSKTTGTSEKAFGAKAKRNQSSQRADSRPQSFVPVEPPMGPSAQSGESGDEVDESTGGVRRAPSTEASIPVSEPFSAFLPKLLQCLRVLSYISNKL